MKEGYGWGLWGLTFPSWSVATLIYSPPPYWRHDDCDSRIVCRIPGFNVNRQSTLFLLRAGLWKKELTPLVYCTESLDLWAPSVISQNQSLRLKLRIVSDTYLTVDECTLSAMNDHQSIFRRRPSQPSVSTGVSKSWVLSWRRSLRGNASYLHSHLPAYLPVFMILLIILDFLES